MGIPVTGLGQAELGFHICAYAGPSMTQPLKPARLARTMSGYPPDWPDNCPPADAEPAKGAVFRIVAADPPNADDLKSYRELGVPARGSECRQRAVSVFQTHDQACHRLRLSPRLGAAIARAELNATHGAVKLTSARSGHIAWWSVAALTPHNRAKLFEEVSQCL